MVSLGIHKDFQAVRYLSFCYLCGRDFVEGDEVDGDHVPPQCTFNVRDRHPVLKLKTHRVCNSHFKVDDKKVGQLVALRRREWPRSPRDQALQFGHYGNMVAVENLHVEGSVWRWIRGFHAALYRRPLLGMSFSIQTPFPRATRHSNGGRPTIIPVLPQHAVAVETIKRNRASGNLDVLTGYRGKLRYECVWGENDVRDSGFCMFALDVYDWKDLGSHTTKIPARGCVGMYHLPDRSIPKEATRDGKYRVVVPNEDPLDAFTR
jgi:hypothetical protein